MSHNFPVPDEAKFERLFVSVYERLPTPEIARLHRVEERLNRKVHINKSPSRANKLPWWIVLLVAGGFATAAWWAGDYLFSTAGTDSGQGLPDNSYTMEQDNINDRTAITGQKLAEPEQQKPAGDDKSSVIYQRENF